MIEPTKISHMAFPAYAEKLNALQALQTEHARIDSQITDFHTQNALKGKDQSAAKNDRVSRLLGDAVPPRDEFAADPGKLQELYRLKADLRTAITEMRLRVDAERCIADEAICAGVKSEHDRRARAICETLIAAHAALKSYAELTDQLNTAGVAWSGRMRPAQMRTLGDPADKHSRLAFYLNDMALSGIIDHSAIPPEVRIEWPPTPKRPPAPRRREKQAPVSETDWSPHA